MPAIKGEIKAEVSSYEAYVSHPFLENAQKTQGNGKQMEKTGQHNFNDADTSAGSKSEMNKCVSKTSPPNEAKVKDKSENILSIHVFKRIKINICKPLIPLKVALFIWYGAASALAIFLMVFYKKKGITLAELSTIYVITPSVQLLGPTISGIIADKLGRPKPVLLVNIVLTNIIVVGMLLSPGLNQTSCSARTANLRCDGYGLGSLTSRGACENKTFELVSCNLSCSQNMTVNDCEGDEDLFCDVLGNDEASRFGVALNLTNWMPESNDTCRHDVSAIMYRNVSYPPCSHPNQTATNCGMECSTVHENCTTDHHTNREGILALNAVLLVLFNAMFSNTYRFLDVTTMFLVKEYDCDFGVQRAFAVIGILVFSPLSGLLVDATTPKGQEKYYESAMVLFVVMTFVLLAVLHRLEVRIRPPGENMWRKSLTLLKNPDVIAFALVLVVLGTAWSFNKNFLFWYLEGMDSPSYLMGLVNSVSALYGLPFLFVAHWWVRKIGTTRIFLLGLTGYIVSGIGYSLLYDPRLALLIELSNVFTYHLLWVAVVMYSHSIAPEGLVATVISTAGGIHFSIGKGTGGLIGGRVMSDYGGRAAFRVIALMSLATAVLYAIYLFVRKLRLERNKSLQQSNGIPNAAFENGEHFQECQVSTHKY